MEYNRRLYLERRTFKRSLPGNDTSRPELFIVERIRVYVRLQHTHVVNAEVRQNEDDSWNLENTFSG
jgi:hypothetical protein